MKVCRKCRKEVRWLHHGCCDDCERAVEWPIDAVICAHDNVESFVGLNRITRTEGGPVTDYVADIEIRCIDCGTEFAFLGFSRGISIERPTVNIDASCLSVPLMPGGACIPELATITVEMPGPVKVDG